MATKDEIINDEIVIAKKNVDDALEKFVERLGTHKNKEDIKGLEFTNIQKYFSEEDIRKIFEKDPEIKRLYEKCMKAQEEFLSTMEAAVEDRNKKFKKYRKDKGSKVKVNTYVEDTVAMILDVSDIIMSSDKAPTNDAIAFITFSMDLAVYKREKDVEVLDFIVRGLEKLPNKDSRFDKEVEAIGKESIASLDKYLNEFRKELFHMRESYDKVKIELEKIKNLRGKDKDKRL